MSDNNGRNGAPSTSAKREEQVSTAFGDALRREQDLNEQATDNGHRHGPHDVEPWPGDPGLEPMALPLADPDDIRRGAVKGGETMRAVSEADLEKRGGFKAVYDALATIRVGAVLSQFERLVAGAKKVRDTTDARKDVAMAEGERARAEAERLQRETPRFEASVARSEDQLADSKVSVQTAEEEREQVLDEVVIDPDPAKSEPEPTPTPAERMGLTGRKLGVLLVIEILIALLQLDPIISRVVPATFVFESELMAGSIAVGVQLSSFFVGRLVFAVRLPERLAALLFIACFGLAAAHLIPDLNLLREGSAKGITALTWVSVMVATIAAATGWASGLQAAFERRLAVYRARPDQLTRRAQEKIEYRQAKVAEALAEVEKAEKRVQQDENALEEHRNVIANLWAVVEGASVSALKERLIGNEAAADVMSEEAVATTMTKSEEAHRDWVINIAWLSWLKRRSEAFLDDAKVSESQARLTTRQPTSGRIPITVIAALVALAGGSIVAWATSSLLALAIGTGVAAVLFGLSLWRSKKAVGAGQAAPYANGAATHPLGEDTPLTPWIRLPESMRPRGGGINNSDTDDIT